MDPSGTLVVIFIFVFSIVFISKGASIIKAWIKRKEPAYDQEKFDRLAKAFIQYKKRSDHRIEQLESELNKISSNPSAATKQSMGKKQSSKSIEIEPKQQPSAPKTPGGKMENMLRDRS